MDSAAVTNFFPCHVTEPLSALSIPSIMRIDVVFPAPLVPSSANTPGSFISKLRPSTALQLPYVLTMLSTLSDIISLSLIC